MIKILVILAIICLAIVAGPYLADSQGFVHVVLGDWIIETSLVTAVIVLTAAYVLLFFLLGIVIRFVRLPRGTSKWFSRHKVRKSASLQDAAFLAYEEGDYKRTVTLIEQSGKKEKLPLKALFTAAKSAFNTGDYEKTRQYLDEAEKRDRTAHIATNIVRAKLNLRVSNPKAALENLDAIKDLFRNKLIYRLYYECYKRLGDIEKLNKSAEQLVKYKLIDEEDAEQINVQFFEHRLKQAETSEELLELWKGLKRHDRHTPRFMGPYVNKLIQLGDVTHAKSVCLELLKKGAEPDFLESVGTWDIAVPEVLTILKAQAQENLIASQVNLPLLKALGNLEFKSGLMQDALDDYRKALELSPTPDIYAKIGQILAAQQNYAEASDYLCKAVSMKENSRALTVNQA